MDERKREFSSTDCISNEIEVSLRMIGNDNKNNESHVVVNANSNSVARYVFAFSIKLYISTPLTLLSLSAALPFTSF